MLRCWIPPKWNFDFWMSLHTWLCRQSCIEPKQKTWKAANLSHAIYWYCLKLQLPRILLQWMDGELTYKIKSWLTFFVQWVQQQQQTFWPYLYCRLLNQTRPHKICSVCNSYQTSFMKRLSSVCAVCLWKNASIMSNNNHLLKKQKKDKGVANQSRVDMRNCYLCSWIYFSSSWLLL